jgi:deoxycytidine triphosphate deaminase/intein/homing endonuclease
LESGKLFFLSLSNFYFFGTLFMTIKSDLWLRRMAEEHEMISPFLTELVRETNGNKIISAGLSSYGYDMRLADDGFRIFSSVYGSEIDPKHFDEKSLIEPELHESEDGAKYYLLPPHHYGLGVTVETFKMPRNVTGVALGKCLTRDAKIIDAETGDLISIADFINDGKVLSHKKGKIEKHSALAVISQGTKQVFTVKTKLGHKITATANHPFLTVSGWQNLESLKVGSRIAATRKIDCFGKEKIADWEALLLGLMIAEGQCHTPGHSPTFTSKDSVLVESLKHSVREGLGTEVSYNGHFGYRLVNKIGRGGIMTANKAHLWLKNYNLDVGALEKFVPSKIFRAPKRSVALFLQALFSGDGSIYLQKGKSHLTAGIEYCSSSEQLARDVHHLLLRFGIISRLREKRTPKQPTFIIQIFRSSDVKLFIKEIGFMPNSEKDIRAKNEILPVLKGRKIQRRIGDTLPKEFWSTLKSEATFFQTSLYASGIHVRNTDKDVSYLELGQFLENCPNSSLSEYFNSDVIWDDIVSIEKAGEEEVFDICVPETKNFVANNLIVHNSTYARAGLLVNTTPLEAGWTGRLVVEIGNLANLPLRVYVNEGIGQILFFESDENCSVSYEDRGGKYQGQTGLTYAKV